MSYFDRMRHPLIATLPFLMAAVLLSCVTACAPREDGPSKSTLQSAPGPSIKAFDTRAEAEAHFERFYQRYLAAANKVFQGGGVDMSRLQDYVTPAQFEREKESVDRFRGVGSRIEGGARLAKFTLQQVDLKAGRATAYVCVDVGGSKLLNRRGQDVTPKARKTLAPLEVKFVSAVRIASSESWSGAGVC